MSVIVLEGKCVGIYKLHGCVCVYICSGRTESGRGERGREREREDELEDYGQLSELSM